MLFEGLLGVVDNQLHTMTYSSVKSTADKAAAKAIPTPATGGWVGFTDKYWLTALVPDQAVPMTTSWIHTNDGGIDHYQVSYATSDAQKNRTRRHAKL